jgi:phage terminase large subunit-like protein
MMCTPLDDGSALFRSEWLAAALQRGRTLPTEFCSTITSRAVVGVDVAFSSTGTADLSAIVVLRILQNGDRLVQSVESGRWSFDEICSRVINAARGWRATAYIESNAGGNYCVEQCRKQIPVKGLATTASSKTARLEWLQCELEAGRWLVHHEPGGAPGAATITHEIGSLVNEIVDYDPESHMGDRMSALLVALEGVRTLEANPRPKGRTDLRLDLMTR